MQTAKAIGITLIFVAALDFLFAGRAAALSPSVDYRYWPFSKLRRITLALLGAAALTFMFAAGPSLHHAPDWALFLLVLAAIIWGAGIMADIAAQREVGNRTPPRYSNPEDV